jgi:hypothetical protein
MATEAIVGDPIFAKAKNVLEELSSNPSVRELVMHRGQFLALYQIELYEVRANALAGKTSSSDESRRAASVELSDDEVESQARALFEQRLTLDPRVLRRMHQLERDWVERRLDIAEARKESREQSEQRLEYAAKGLVSILEIRDFELPDEARCRILACRDADRLKAWLQRSRTAPTVRELFG